MNDVFEDRAVITYFDQDSINVSLILESAMKNIKLNMLFVIIAYLIILFTLVSMYYRVNKKECALKRSFGISKVIVSKETQLELCYLTICSCLFSCIICFLTHELVINYYLDKKEIGKVVTLKENIIFAITSTELMVIPVTIISTLLLVWIYAILISKKQLKKSILYVITDKNE